MRPPSSLVGGVLAASLLLLGACGEGEPAADPTSSTSEPTPTQTSSDGPSTSADLELAPGAVGPVTVGMTQDQAAATGLFDVDLPDDGCGTTPPLTWKPAFAGVDVLTDPSGAVVSLGVSSADGPRTADDLGVGSTFGELIGVYADRLSAPEEAGYGQAGVFVQDGDRWLGFLFGDKDLEGAENDEGSVVTFVEATEGEKPSLIRDGC